MTDTLNGCGYKEFCAIINNKDVFTILDLVNIHNCILRKFIGIVKIELIDVLIRHNFSIFSVYSIIMKMIKMKKYAKASVFINQYGTLLQSSFIANIIIQNLFDQNEIIMKYILRFSYKLNASDIYRVLQHPHLYNLHNYMSVIKKLPIENTYSLDGLLWVPNDVLSYFLTFRDKFLILSRRLKYCTFDKIKFIYKQLKIPLPDYILRKYPKLKLLYWQIQLIRKLRLIRQVKDSKRYISFVDGLKNITQLKNIQDIITYNYKSFPYIASANFS